MKKRAVYLVALLTIAQALLSQVPQSFSYQAILRNADGSIKANESVTVMIEILQGSIEGNTAYLEVHNVTTNSKGLIIMDIGSGTTSDDLSSIDWGNGPYFLSVTVDGINLGANQLLSVPYALHAKVADTIKGGINETDPDFNAWDKSTGIVITESQISNLQGYLTVESDPVFSESEASRITSEHFNNIQNLGGINTGDQDLSGYASIESLNELKAQVEMIQIELGFIVKDIEGNVYPTVKIGDQVWMATNLRSTKYSDGTSIPQVEPRIPWDNLTDSERAFCWAENDSLTHAELFGALYSWAAAMNGSEISNLVPSGVQGVCPEGWHLPSGAEWDVLSNLFGGDAVSGAALKQEGTEYWLYPNTGTNESHFNALPAPVVSDDGLFYGAGSLTKFWTTQGSSVRSMEGASDYLYKWTEDPTNGYSVRCIKDE